MDATHTESEGQHRIVGKGWMHSTNSQPASTEGGRGGAGAPTMMKEESLRSARTFRFEITVDETHKVQVLEGGSHLGRVESGTVLGQAFACK